MGEPSSESGSARRQRWVVVQYRHHTGKPTQEHGHGRHEARSIGRPDEVGGHEGADGGRYHSSEATDRSDEPDTGDRVLVDPVDLRSAGRSRRAESSVVVTPRETADRHQRQGERHFLEVQPGRIRGIPYEPVEDPVEEAPHAGEGREQAADHSGEQHVGTPQRGSFGANREEPPVAEPDDPPDHQPDQRGQDRFCPALDHSGAHQEVIEPAKDSFEEQNSESGSGGQPDEGTQQHAVTQVTGAVPPTGQNMMREPDDSPHHHHRGRRDPEPALQKSYAPEVCTGTGGTKADQLRHHQVDLPTRIHPARTVEGSPHPARHQYEAGPTDDHAGQHEGRVSRPPDHLGIGQGK